MLASYWDMRASSPPPLVVYFFVNTEVFRDHLEDHLEDIRVISMLKQAWRCMCFGKSLWQYYCQSGTVLNRLICKCPLGLVIMLVLDNFGTV